MRPRAGIFRRQPNMPTLIPDGDTSRTSVSYWLNRNRPPRQRTSATRRVFWAVTAVRIPVPRKPKRRKTATSKRTPAPGEGSYPAIERRTLFPAVFLILMDIVGVLNRLYGPAGLC